MSTDEKYWDNFRKRYIVGVDFAKPDGARLDYVVFDEQGRPVEQLATMDKPPSWPPAWFGPALAKAQALDEAMGHLRPHLREDEVRPAYTAILGHVERGEPLPAFVTDAMARAAEAKRHALASPTFTLAAPLVVVPSVDVHALNRIRAGIGARGMTPNELMQNCFNPGRRPGAGGNDRTRPGAHMPKKDRNRKGRSR